MQKVRGSGPGLPGLTPRIHDAQATKSKVSGASTLAIKPMGGVNQSAKQRVPVAPQFSDIDIITTKHLKKDKSCNRIFWNISYFEIWLS